jgi:hypothetical protein
MTMEFEEGKLLDQFLSHGVSDLLLHPSAFLFDIQANEIEVELSLIATVCRDPHSCGRRWGRAFDTRNTYTVLFNLLYIDTFEVGNDVGIVI